MTTDTETLLALALRVEQATGADRELDADIAIECQRLPHPVPEGQRATKSLVTDCFDGAIRVLWQAKPPLLSSLSAFNYDPLLFTSSTDVAMSLVPDGLDWSIYTVEGHYAATLGTPDEWLFIAAGATPALALTAASLRARALAGRVE